MANAFHVEGIKKGKNMFDFEEIKKILKHRFPLLMVDKVLEITEKKVIAIKNVSGNDIFFQGHFPEKAILPGALIIEGMAQIAAIAGNYKYFLKKKKNPHPMPYLGSVKARFYYIVVPGDVLRYEADIIRSSPKRNYAEIKVFVGEKKVAEGELINSSAKG